MKDIKFITVSRGEYYRNMREAYVEAAFGEGVGSVYFHIDWDGVITRTRPSASSTPTWRTPINVRCAAPLGSIMDENGKPMLITREHYATLVERLPQVYLIPCDRQVSEQAAELGIEVRFVYV